MDHHRQALDIAQACADDLADRARAVALTGSVAAGTDHRDSDIDLIAVVDRPAPIDIRSIRGRMVTIGWKTPADIRESFTRPWEAGVAVAAWREAAALHDRDRTLAALQDEAREWRWEMIGRAADRWTAAGTVGLAEETHKIAGMLTTHRLRAACANRAILVLRLPGILAVAHRLLYRTDNDLWDLVCRAEGPEWAAAWDAAAGVASTDARSGCLGALMLYRIAAARVDPVLSPDEAAVVERACLVAASAFE